MSGGVGRRATRSESGSACRTSRLAYMPSWSDQSVEAIAARVRAASPAHLARGAGVGRPAAAVRL